MKREWQNRSTVRLVRSNSLCATRRPDCLSIQHGKLKIERPTAVALYDMIAILVWYQVSFKRSMAVLGVMRSGVAVRLCIHKILPGWRGKKKQTSWARFEYGCEGIPIITLLRRLSIDNCYQRHAQVACVVMKYYHKSSLSQYHQQ